MRFRTAVHGPSRDHLLAEVIRRCFRQFADYLDDRGEHADLHEDLGALGHRCLSFAAEHPLEYRLMFGTPWPAPAEQLRLVEDARHALDVLRTVLRRIHGANRAQRTRVDLDAMFIWSQMHGLASITQANVMDHLGRLPQATRQMVPHAMQMLSLAMEAALARRPPHPTTIEMLTDTALRNLRPGSKPYKITDRDGMYAVISSAGTVTFRYDYRLNGRRETLTIGRYGRDDISLAMARERLAHARRAVREGKSPAIEKQREKRRLARAKTFGEFAVQWLKDARMADTTRSMRRSILDRDITPTFELRLLCEISADDLRALCQKIKARGAPATAVHARDIVKQIYAFANLHGEKVPNPADDVGAASIATFVPKDRALSPTEIRLMHRQMETVATYPTTRLALRMILLTLVRKSELIQATWDEVDFEAAVWTIPKARMKARRPHNVYLSQQALDIMVTLHTCAAGSRYVLPSRYDPDRCMSQATLNRVTQLIVERAKAAGLSLGPFTVHDLRRTGSTLLNEAGFNREWIEKCLAHEEGRLSRSVYNKAEYAEQRRHMRQEWGNMIDAWAVGEAYTPTLCAASRMEQQLPVLA